MNNIIYKISLSLSNSKRYKSVKFFIRSVLENPNYRYKRYFDIFMISLIVISITVLMVGKTDKIPYWIVNIDLYFITTIFLMEYLLRLWIKDDMHEEIITSQGKKGLFVSILKKKLYYMLSLPALIDLIAIFPKFRIVRLLKLYNYMHGASALFDALIKKRFEFIFLGYLLFGITFTLGSVLYFLEYGVNESLHSYLDAVYWALVTVSTVGYGDISPVTDLGKIVSMVGIVFGIAMISFVTSVMVSAFSERFDELRNQNSINNVAKMKNVVIINGYGQLGATIANKLKNSTLFEPVVVEMNEDKIDDIVKDGHVAICADSTSSSIIKTLHSKENVVSMITLKNSDIDNIYFILNAKSINKNCPIYSRLNNKSLKKQYNLLDIDNLVEPYSIVNQKAFNYLNQSKEKTTNGILFLGYTNKSREICLRLKDEGVLLSICETDSVNYQQAIDDGFVQVTLVDRDNHAISNVSQKIVVCAMNEESINAYYAITLRADNFDGAIVALSYSKDDNRKLYLAGVSKIFDMYEESANQFVEMMTTSHFKS